MFRRRTKPPAVETPAQVEELKKLGFHFVRAGVTMPPDKRAKLLEDVKNTCRARGDMSLELYRRLMREHRGLLKEGI
jgi:hypothetical protein